MASGCGQKRVLEMAQSPTAVKKCGAQSHYVEKKTGSEKRSWSQYLKECSQEVAVAADPHDGIVVSISDDAFEKGKQLRGEQFTSFKDASTAPTTR